MEALGAAASVIGVTSLAIQVCEELKKIHDFWQSVKEAPDDIAHISTEINLFMTWLTVMANNYQRQGFDHKSPNHVAATDTLKLCLAAVHDMNDGVKDLVSRISTGLLFRRWASVKFVFRKEKKEKLLQQIERMKSLLIIVQTCYIGEIQEAGFRSLSMSMRLVGSASQATSDMPFLDLSTVGPTTERFVIGTQKLQSVSKPLLEMVGFDSEAAPPANCRPHRRMIKQEQRTYNLGLAILRLVATELETSTVEESGNKRRISAQRTRCDLRMAQWLVSRGFSWQTFNVYGSWHYSFRTFRYIPEDALIVDFCIEGDVANVQRMFEKGLASPLDRVRRTKQGDWSLLHFAIANSNVQLCKFLIECGLGDGSASSMSKYPILSLVGYWSGVSDPGAHIDILRLMVIEGQYDPMEEANHTSIMHSLEGSPLLYRWLLDQDEFLIDFEQSVVNWDTFAGALLVKPNSNSSSRLEAVIAHGSDLRDPGGSGLFGDGLSLAHRATWFLFEVADNVDPRMRTKVLWDAGADFHTPKSRNRFGTTLDALFQSFLYNRLFHCRRKDERCKFNRKVIPAPTLMPVEEFIEYDRVEEIKFRSRIPKSLWFTWYAGIELSVLEVAQRWLDAWMEILHEAGIDIAEYGRREHQLHPDCLLHNSRGQARIYFEYGEHVDGCRIHATEIWMYDHYGVKPKKTMAAESSTMPCSWDFDDA